MIGEPSSSPSSPSGSSSIPKRVSTESAASQGTGETWSNKGSVNTDWQLKSVPGSIFIESRMMLSSRLGMYLDGRGYLDICVGVCIIFQVTLSLLAPVDTSSWTSPREVLEISRSICIMSHAVVALCLTFLLLHRCNRKLLHNVMFLPRSVIVLLFFLIAHLTWVLSPMHTKPSDWIRVTLENSILMVFRLPLMLIASATDSIYAARTRRLVIVLLLCACGLWAWLDSWCFSHAWGKEPKCTFSIREIWLSCQAQQLVFLVNGWLNIAFGNMFSYTSPRFVPNLSCEQGDGNDGGGVWYYCKPSTLFVKRKMILSTSIGDLLERYRLMNAVLAISIFLHVVCMIFRGRWNRFSKNEAGVVVRIVEPGYFVAQSGAVVTIFFFMFLLLHRYNAELSRMSCKRFESLFILAMGLSTQSLMHYRELHAYGVGDDLLLRVLIYIGVVLTRIAMAGADALRGPRWGKLAILTAAIIAISYTFFDNRCFSLRWEEEASCKEFIPGNEMSVSFREIYLSSMLGISVFFLRAFSAHLSGNCFAVWCPSYVPASTLHTPGPSIGNAKSPDAGDQGFVDFEQDPSRECVDNRFSVEEKLDEWVTDALDSFADVEELRAPRDCTIFRIRL